MPEQTPILVISQLEKSYGALKALDRVDLEVREGEFVVLLGPNGAGKTTLVQLLSGLFLPDGGSIHMFGADMRREPLKILARLGIVFQQPTLDLELSVEANLRYHADLHGMDRRLAGQRIEVELGRVGLLDQRRTATRRLSGGNRRRVELARAMLHNPRLLIMDEATVGLDPESRAALLDHVRQLRTEAGLGTLWTTHLLDEAEQADRVVVLHRGRILFDGSPAELAIQQASETIESAFLKLTREPV
jgi:ABC-2 type transport system ATP-binding protein